MTKIILVKKGENRKSKVKKVSMKLAMKHLSKHDKPGDRGIQIRIVWKKKIHTDWVGRHECSSWDECFDRARVTRDIMLKEIGRSLSTKNIIGTVVSNTGYKGISYRPNFWEITRGKRYEYEIFEYRWFSGQQGRYRKGRIALRANGGYNRALKEARRRQKRKETEHKIRRKEATA